MHHKAKTTDELHLQKVYATGEDYLKFALVENPHLHPEIQEKLLTNQSQWIRERLLYNPNLYPQFFPRLFTEFKFQLIAHISKNNLWYKHQATRQLLVKYLDVSYPTKMTFSKKINKLDILKDFDDKYYLYFMQDDKFFLSDDVMKDIKNIQSMHGQTSAHYLINPTLFVKETKQEVDFELTISWSK